MATFTAISEKTQSATAMKRVIDYVLQDKKTMFHDEITGVDYKLIGGQSCVPEAAYAEFMATKHQYGKANGVIQIILGALIILSVVTLVMLASLLSIKTHLRIILIMIGVVIMFGGISCLCVLDVHTGYFKCPNCGETFVPTIKEYVISLHTFSKRKLLCPHCKTKQWCKKVTTKSDEH